MVGAVRDAVAALAERVAAALEALAEAERHVAGGRAPRQRDVGEHQQPGVSAKDSHCHNPNKRRHMKNWLYISGRKKRPV